jgi:hypothetical protein
MGGLAGTALQAAEQLPPARQTMIRVKGDGELCIFFSQRQTGPPSFRFGTLVSFAF